MFRMILATQWKWTRAPLLLAVLLGFGLPLASMQFASGGYSPQEYVQRMQIFGIGYALLAAGVGLAVALSAWVHDQRGRHVYALILPVSRARYVLLRMAAGATFVMVPAAAILLGALAVMLVGAIPEGLHAYPVALALRFAFAALVAYALFFAIGASTQKTAGILLGAIVTLALAQYVLTLGDVKLNVLRPAVEFLFTSPGVFSVFAGRWTLVDA